MHYALRTETGGFVLGGKMNKFRSMFGMRGLSLILCLMLVVSIVAFGAARAVYADEGDGSSDTTETTETVDSADPGEDGEKPGEVDSADPGDTTTTGETEEEHEETPEEKAARKAAEKKARIKKAIPYAIVSGVVAALITVAIIIPNWSRSNGRITTQQLTESALMIAIATVCSLVKIDISFGGGVTIVSMLPLVMISHRYGWRWGILTAYVYSIIQLIFGLDNVGWATSFIMAVAIVFLDYIIAYTVIGLSGIFGKKRSSVAIGIAVTFTLRFLCHFMTGIWVWDEWMPEEYFGLTMTSPALYSLLYNGWYMLAELIITEIVAMLVYKPLKKYFTGEDVKA